MIKHIKEENKSKKLLDYDETYMIFVVMQLVPLLLFLFTGPNYYEFKILAILVAGIYPTLLLGKKILDLTYKHNQLANDYNFQQMEDQLRKIKNG